MRQELSIYKDDIYINTYLKWHEDSIPLKTPKPPNHPKVMGYKLKNRGESPSKPGDKDYPKKTMITPN
jgi:hypothetical protein